ncbi:MAG: sensor histidine kinase, partial [Spirochaetia bacterium]|nr:sensor histidine kinase [Spirochaetia bacterium]
AVQELINDANGLGDRLVSFSIHGNVTELDEDEEQTVYRLVQESLTNSLRHSGGADIEVVFSYASHLLNVMIADNGQGCRTIRKHFGLDHIEEQIGLLGGSVRFETAEGEGFRTKASIPLRKGGFRS